MVWAGYGYAYGVHEHARGSHAWQRAHMTHEECGDCATRATRVWHGITI